MAHRVFVDEVKYPDYILVATMIDESAISSVRKALRKHVMTGQRRIHFHSEREARRNEVFRSIEAIRPTVTLYISSNKNQALARTECLVSLVSDALGTQCSELVIERDESLVDQERKLLARLIGVAMVYRHENAAREPALWISDAVGWAYRRGGKWRARVISLGVTIRAVP